jgi:Ribbon-helix-helix protein, copG family
VWHFLERNEELKMKKFKSIEPDCVLSFHLTKEMLAGINKICRDHDMTRAQFLRRAVKDWISVAELEEERPGSVIDPKDV